MNVLLYFIKKKMSVQKNKSAQRIFLPGDKWVYIKLYTGQQTADKIILNNISLLIKKLEKEKLIEKFFFVRYRDPEFHIRIRFLLTKERTIDQFFQILIVILNKLLKNKLIWKVQFDTYIRELERYEDSNIEDTETIFHIDSKYTIAILKEIEKNRLEHYRWLICLKMIDALLTNFKLDISEKYELVNNLSIGFKTEFGFNYHNSKQFKTKYRENKKNIEWIFNDSFTNKELYKINKTILKRSLEIEPIINNIVNLESAKAKKKIDTLISSYLHMMINRFFRSKNRTYELLLYDFMRRHYLSKMARNKYNLY